MIKLHLANNTDSIWINENLIVSLRPSGAENTDISLLGDFHYTVLGKPSTIATMILYNKEDR